MQRRFSNLLFECSVDGRDQIMNSLRFKNVADGACSKALVPYIARRIFGQENDF